MGKLSVSSKKILTDLTNELAFVKHTNELLPIIQAHLKKAGLPYNISIPPDNPDVKSFLKIENEKEFLSSVSREINCCHSREDLLTIVNNRLLPLIQSLQEYKLKLEDENFFLQEQVQTNQQHENIIGSSKGLQNVFYLVAKVSQSDSTVLLLGETGTGKELIAKAIHDSSSRKEKLMIKINCASMPVSLIESELFGHEKGSFTGASERRIGRFELANNSTLFLDEIGELSLDMQVKLLRVIQEKEIERIGGHEVIKTNVRIIAATNRNLEKEVAENRFRKDLYYRLNVFPISLPPLRDRKEDIPLLASRFMIQISEKLSKPVNRISPKAMNQLINYHWPGNVRELEHLIERTILLTNGSTIKEVILSTALEREGFLASSIKTIAQIEREHILSVLKKTGGKIHGDGGAAELLKIPATTLSSKMKKLGIKKNHL